MSILKVAVITLIALTLAGCGGGGSSSTTTTQVITPDDSATVRLA